MRDRPGAIVPIIPHKQAMRESVRFSDDLLQDRTKELDYFLKAVASHPELHDTKCLEVFLTDNDQWDLNRMEEEKKLPTSESLGFLGKTIKKLTTVGVSEIETTPDDGAMEIMQDYLTHMDTQVKMCAKESSALIKYSLESSKSLQSMGAALAALGQKPYPQAYTDPTGELSGKLATKISDLALVQLKQSEQGTIKLDEPMQELARLVQAAKAALQRRREVVWAYTAKVKLVKDKKRLLEQLKASEQDVSDAQQDSKDAYAEVEQVSKRVRREMERFRDVFHAKFSKAIGGYAQLQKEYHGHVEKKWTSILPLVTTSTDSGGEAPLAVERGSDAPQTENGTHHHMMETEVLGGGDDLLL
jgi:sorting nexin-1/2